ncbi:hypothetical protein [Pararhizobium sp. A13]|uniref:hypothetical protein n=1 Tax=Pararhizobium sp. A13 TaxID=3133975 RepID=UPI0032551BF6
MVSLGLNTGLGLAGAGSAWFVGATLTAADANDGVAKLPAFVADFRMDRHAVTHVIAANIAAAAVDALVSPHSVPFSDLFVFTRGSAAEYIDAAGVAQQAAADVPRFDYRYGHRQLLIEGPAANLFLNAFSPATQTIAVTYAAQYTVSCRGSGSLVLSGAVTATVTQPRAGHLHGDIGQPDADGQRRPEPGAAGNGGCGHLSFEGAGSLWFSRASHRCRHR